MKITNFDSIKNEMGKYMVNYLFNNIKTNMGVEVKICLFDGNYNLFLSWLKKYDKNFKSHITIKRYTNGKIKYMLKDCDFIIKCGNRTFARIYTQTAIKNTLSDADKFSGKRIHDGDIYMYIFGKECYKIAKIIYDIDNTKDILCFKISPSKYSKNDTYNTEIFREDIIRRSEKSIFLNGNTKDIITNHVDKFLQNKEIYNERNLIYKTGILLYGEPGTGKSSIANMIASKYNIDIILINMSEFSYINIDFLTTTINADSRMYLIILEDIDCVIGDRQDENDDLENKKNVNKLLQFLDSTSSPTNVIFVATTNHIDKLDDAIKRDGRFDLIVNITNIDRPTAKKMCKSFGIDDESISKLLKKNMQEETINPAKLQNLILQEIKSNND